MINARNLSLIGAAGHGEVTVRRRPLVAILSTGDELVEPGTPPAEGQIVSSNGVFLQHLVKALGGEPMPLGIIADRDDALDAALSRAMDADLIITSGELRLAHMTASPARCSRPVIFLSGGLRCGRANRCCSGISKKGPQNPCSACPAILFHRRLRVDLRCCSNPQPAGSGPSPHLRPCRMTAPLNENDQRQDFLRARLEHGTDGRMTATAFSKQDSGMLSVLAEANGLIMRPPHAPPPMPVMSCR